MHAFYEINKSIEVFLKYVLLFPVLLQNATVEGRSTEG